MAITFRVIDSVAEVSAEQWDGLACPDPALRNPTVSHAFFHALEKSGSACTETGWRPQHLVMEEGGKIVGIVPCYLKSHSMGEYVFDHGFADAFHRAGGRYYPKMQVSVPFTPVTGPRVFAATADRRMALAAALQEQAKAKGASSAHITFLPDDDSLALAGAGFLQREDIQFHWHNAGYAGFDDFLAGLSSSKRKNIRKERAAVAARGIRFIHATGESLLPEHWDHFFHFYMDTGSRKWGKPYLTRSFFDMLQETMRAEVLLVLAERDGAIIAGALNFIGGDRLYGRNWGCVEDHPFLHFETCYYQAIDFAIARRLKVVEAGAQGEHKLARGYLPVRTHSLHHFVHPGLRRAVAEYLEAERAGVAQDVQALSAHSPFRHTEQD